MKNLLIKLLRRPVFWALDCLMKSWRKALPELQRRRAEASDSSLLRKACENIRKATNEWDKIKELRQNIAETTGTHGQVEQIAKKGTTVCWKKSVS